MAVASYQAAAGTKRQEAAVGLPRDSGALHRLAGSRRRLAGCFFHCHSRQYGWAGYPLYDMPQARIARRMMTLAVCSFGFAASFALGALTSFNPYLSAGTLAFTVFLVT